MTAPRILLLAGEASGDQHGAHLARALLRRFPEARLEGLGGPRMVAEGVETWAGLDRLAVMGFVEVLKHLPFFRALELRVKDELDRGADLVIPIDYPGFNLRVARAAHGRGIPVLYYIAPQVWAWKPGRAARLAEHARGLAVILPFEVEVFQRHGLDTRFVGHPLLEESVEDLGRDEFCGRAGLDPERPILALFPGSRQQEIDRHLAVFVRAAERLRDEHGELQVVLARGSSVELGELPASVDAVVDQGRPLLRHARAAVVKSGTSTLEAAIEGVPFVTVYRTHPVTHFMARRLVKLDHIALANLVAGREVVPELIQDEATPEAIAHALGPLLVDGPARSGVLAGLASVRASLGEPGVADRVSAWAADLLEG